MKRQKFMSGSLNYVLSRSFKENPTDLSPKLQIFEQVRLFASGTLKDISGNVGRRIKLPASLLQWADCIYIRARFELSVSLYLVASDNWGQALEGESQRKCNIQYTVAEGGDHVHDGLHIVIHCDMKDTKVSTRQNTKNGPEKTNE